MITRDQAISRAQNWVDRRIPYSQSALTGKLLMLFYRESYKGIISIIVFYSLVSHMPLCFYAIDALIW